MKKLLLLPVLVAALCTTSYAQSARQAQAETQSVPVPAYVQAETDQMTNSLGLNAAQSKSILAVNSTAASRSVRLGTMANKQQVDNMQKDIDKYRNDEYQKILTRGQYQKWQKQQEGSKATSK